MRSPSDSMSGSATQIDTSRCVAGWLLDRLVTIQGQRLPSDARIAAAQQADVVDLLTDRRGSTIKANAHGQPRPLLTWQITLVQKPRVDLPHSRTSTHRSPTCTSTSRPFMV